MVCCQWSRGWTGSPTGTYFWTLFVNCQWLSDQWPLIGISKHSAILALHFQASSLNITNLSSWAVPCWTSELCHRYRKPCSKPSAWCNRKVCGTTPVAACAPPRERPFGQNPGLRLQSDDMHFSIYGILDYRRFWPGMAWWVSQNHFCFFLWTHFCFPARCDVTSKGWHRIPIMGPELQFLAKGTTMVTSPSFPCC